jgi:hypothetical protein
MASSQVTIGAAIRYAWTLLRANFRAIWGVLALAALASTVSTAGRITSNLGLQAIAAPAVLVTTLMVYGALFRLAFADRHADQPEFRIGHQGLQWGGVEWRMLAASVLVVVFLTIIALTLLCGLAAIVTGVLAAQGVQPATSMTPEQFVAAVGKPWNPTVVFGVAVVSVVLAYLRVRLSLAAPASADQKGVRVLQTWKHTRGHVWPMLAAMLFVILPAMIISGWIARSMMSDEGLPVDVGPTATLFAALALGATLGLFVTPMIAGVYAYFYRALALRAPPPAPRP